MASDKELTSRQREYLENVNIGIQTVGEVEKAMGEIPSGSSSQYCRYIEEAGFPEFRPQFYNGRIEAAIELRQTGKYSWSQIGRMLKFKNPWGVYQSVKQYLGGNNIQKLKREGNGSG